MSLKQNISLTFSAQVVNTIVAFIASVIITRILGIAGRGEYAIFTNSVGFSVLFFGFSITSTIPFYLNSEKAKAGDLLTTILIFISASTLLVFLTLYILKSSGKLNLAIPATIQTSKYELMFVLLFVNTLLNSVLISYLTAYKKFKEVAILSITSQILPLILYLLLYYSIDKFKGIAPIGMIVSIMTIVSAMTLLFAIIVFKYVLKIKPSAKLIPGFLIKNFVLFSGMAYLGNVFQFFSYKIDFWFVDAYCGKEKLGIYSLAAQLAQLFWILPQSLSSVLYSYASKMTREDALAYALKFKTIAFYASLLLALFGILGFYFFIPVLFGEAFRESFYLLALFLIGVVPFSVPIVIASFFAALGQFKISFYTSIAVSIFTLILYSVLIPKFGIYGGVLGSIISYLISFIISEWWLVKIYKVNTLSTYFVDYQTIKNYFITIKQKLFNAE